MKILVVDDHPIFQRGLTELIRVDFPQANVKHASTAREALDALQKESWKLVTLDLSLPDRNGLDVLKEIKELHPHVPVLILTLHSEDRFAIRALRAGADGYLTKQSSPGLVPLAIRKLLEGGKYLSTALAEKLAVGLTTDFAERPHEHLSDREYQVMQMLAQGRTVGSIALILHLSVNTISTYRSRILEKLNVENTAQLVAYAIQNQLVD